MHFLVKIGLFIGVGLALNQLVNLIYRIVSKKTNAIHLRFLKSIFNVMIDVVIIYSLVQQFEITKDISKALLQSGTLIVAIATFAAQQALANVISGIWMMTTLKASRLDFFSSSLASANRFSS